MSFLVCRIPHSSNTWNLLGQSEDLVGRSSTQTTLPWSNRKPTSLVWERGDVLKATAAPVRHKCYIVVGYLSTWVCHPDRLLQTGPTCVRICHLWSAGILQDHCITRRESWCVWNGHTWGQRWFSIHLPPWSGSRCMPPVGPTWCKPAWCLAMWTVLRWKVRESSSSVCIQGITEL